MCLENVIKEIEEDDELRWGYGYKVMNRCCNGKITPPVFGSEGVNIGNKSTAINGLVWTDSRDMCYKFGFHIFLELDDAKLYHHYLGLPINSILVKVAYTQGRLLGKQYIGRGSMADCIIADRIKYLEIVK